MYPFDVGHAAVFQSQVCSAQMFLDSRCHLTIDNFDRLMQVSPPELQGQIDGMLAELSDKVKEGERVQAMGEVSLEVAALFRL